MKPLRHATPEDAPRVHALLIEAFADDLLPFTIYRAPQAVGRLATLAAEGHVRTVGEVEGVALTSGSHLAYLAVAARARGQGLGRRLMGDFHADKGATTLDVLADNPARRLYERMGYAPEKASFSARIPLKNTGFPPETWMAALRDEARDGFSAVAHDGMRIGLLRGTALRLLDPGSRSVEEARAALAEIGFAGRRELVLTGLDEPPKEVETIQVVQSLRMKRNG